MNGASSDGTHRDRPTKHDSWERTIGVCSVVIAVCALVATLWQEASSREHNRLSVRPILDIVIGLASDSSPAGVSLENRGVGPAIIRTSNVFRGDAPIGSISTNTTVLFALQIFPTGRCQVTQSVTRDDRQRAIRLNSQRAYRERRCCRTFGSCDKRLGKAFRSSC